MTHLEISVDFLEGKLKKTTRHEIKCESSRLFKVILKERYIWNAFIRFRRVNLSSAVVDNNFCVE